MVEIADIRSAESVHRWLTSRLELWGAKSVHDGLLETLARFCEDTGKGPDEMVGDCLRPGKDRDTFVLRTRARREYMERIEQFESSAGSRAEGNIVRSFFIHNGVAMNPSILA